MKAVAERVGEKCEFEDPAELEPALRDFFEKTERKLYSSASFSLGAKE